MKIPEKIEVPAPTAWPIVLAFGLTLVLAGFVTAASVSLLGVVLAIAGAVGWFREVLPVESHESVPVVPEGRDLGADLHQGPKVNPGVHF